MSDRDGRSRLLSFFRRSAGELTEALGDRVELFSIELQQEKEELIRSFFWNCGVFFCALNACIFGSLAVVLALGAERRLAAYIGLAIFYGLAALVVFLLARRRERRLARPFECTIEQLRRDQEAIQN